MSSPNAGMPFSASAGNAGKTGPATSSPQLMSSTYLWITSTWGAISSAYRWRTRHSCGRLAPIPGSGGRPGPEWQPRGQTATPKCQVSHAWCRPEMQRAAGVPIVSSAYRWITFGYPQAHRRSSCSVADWRPVVHSIDPIATQKSARSSQAGWLRSKVSSDRAAAPAVGRVARDVGWLCKHGSRATWPLPQVNGLRRSRCRLVVQPVRPAYIGRVNRESRACRLIVQGGVAA